MIRYRYVWYIDTIVSTNLFLYLHDPILYLLNENLLSALNHLVLSSDYALDDISSRGADCHLIIQRDISAVACLT